MKVLIISNAYPSDQKPYAGIFVKNQYEFLKTNGVNVRILYMRRKLTGIGGSLAKYIKVTLNFIPHLFRNYTILHLHFFYPLITLAYLYKLIHRDVKLIVTFHGSDINKDVNGKVKLLLFKFLSRKIDSVIAVSNDLGSTIEKKLNIPVKNVLCAGVDKAVFFPLASTTKRYDFAFVGSLSKIKGVDTLVKAIREWERKDIKFIFIGSGSLKNKIVELSDHGFNVSLLSNLNQEDLRTIYNETKWLILPSRRDAFGLVVTESLYCGTPVIVSPLPGIQAQIKEGKNSLTIKAQSLLNTLIKANSLTKEEYDYFREESLLSNDQFSLQNVGQELISLYSKIETSS